MPLSRIVIIGNDDVAALAADMLAHAVRPPFVAVHWLRPTEAVSSWAALAYGATLTPEAAGIADAAGRDELDLLRAARGNFLVGTVLREFAPGGPTFLPFGAIGEPLGTIGFHHLVARRRRSDAALPLTAFMGGSLCAQSQRFAPPSAADSAAQAAFNYGLHLDSERLAATTTARAAQQGVTISDAAVGLITRNDAGCVTAVTDTDGNTITGDLFIDCGNWLDDEPAVVDWSQWLPCNRFAAAIRGVTQPPLIAQQLVAHQGGWQRQSSLAGAVIDSFAFCDAVRGDWPASAIAFRSGRSEAPWRGNCVSIGDGAVIIDPICDLRMHLALTAIARIAALLPTGGDQMVEAREYNRQTTAELDHARDFAIAYYWLNMRRGDPFWDQCRAIVPPETLAARLDLYRSCGRIAALDHDPYQPAEWIALFDALGVRPATHDALADFLPAAAVETHLTQVRERLMQRVGAMPPYRDTVRLIAEF